MSISRTVVISCAGMGKRLGIGTTKCLLDVAGEALIIRHLKMLDDVDDVRIVVGYQAEKVIEIVRQYRSDVTFVFNHDYAHNGTGASVSLAAQYANEYILTIDGDLLIHPVDMKMILEQEGEFVGVTKPGTDNPVLTEIKGDSVVGFSRERGSFEWTGVCQVRVDNLQLGEGHVYELIEPHLPIEYLYIRTKEIDTMNDYDNAESWVQNGYSDDVVIGVLGGMGSYATVDVFRRIVDAFPARYEWDRPRVLIDNYCTMPSRVRAVLYGERRAELSQMIANALIGLIHAGATDVFLACNTSYALLEEVTSLVPESSKYLVDIIELLAIDMEAAGISSAFLMASEGTLQANVYQERFTRHGISIISASEMEQGKIRKFIECVKQNRVTSDISSEFISFIVDCGHADVILGCTELPVLWRNANMPARVADVRVHDPLQSVIDYLVGKVSGRSK